jgi:hypothetical protein
MKRSIAIIALVVAAICIIPLVAQTGTPSASCPKAEACEQGQGQGCQGKCEQGGEACEDCPQKVSGECEGYQGKCEKSCDKGADEASESGQGCGMGQSMGQGCGMGGGCGMGQGAQI